MKNSGKKVVQCFLSGLDSTQCLMHAMRIVDPFSDTIDDVYVSDMCWRIVCDSDDEKVASFWVAWKQAYSAGYTDAGFVSNLKNELAKTWVGLALLTYTDGRGTYFLSYTPTLSKPSGKLRLWCRGRIPIPARVVDTAIGQGIPHLLNDNKWPWIRERWLIATPPTRQPIVFAEPPWHSTLFDIAAQQWGEPPDLFSYAANSQTTAGYELIRRVLV